VDPATAAADASSRITASVDVAGPPRFAYLAALLIGVIAFVFRLLTLRSLTDDHYLYLSAAQQILLGEIPGRDFVDPGMPLQFLLSAVGQAVAPGPATEGFLTIAILAMATAMTAIAVSWLTRSVAAGTCAALFEMLMQPRLYSFPKIIVPAVLIVLVLWYARRPRRLALVPLAAWITIAFLLRHDIGVYAALAAATGVALSHERVADAARASAGLAVLVLLALLPYFVFLTWNVGVAEHVREAFEYGKAEWHQLRFAWPTFGFGTPGDPDASLPWSRDDAATFFFYAAYGLPIASGLLLARAENRRDVLVRSGIGAGIVLSVAYAAIILRHPLVTRVQDLAAVYAVLGGWSAVALLQATPTQGRPPFWSWSRHALTRVGMATTLAVALISIDVLGEVRVEFRVAGLTNSPQAVRARAREVMSKGRQWPWDNFWPAGDLPPAIEYLDMCVGPEDRIWLTWQAPEYYVFARRGFGAGHPMTMAPHSFTTARDQDLMIARLEQHRVPLVLINESMRTEFAGAYPRVDEYLQRQYVPVGEFEIRGDETIAIAVRRGFKATNDYGEQRWPCGMVPDDGLTSRRGTASEPLQ